MVNYSIPLQMKYSFSILSEKIAAESRGTQNKILFGVTLDTEANFYLKIQNKCFMRSGIR